MSGLERKQVEANQSAAILFDKNSELFPVTRQKLDNLRETLKQDKLTPWFWFNSRGVNVARFSGKPISMSGCCYDDSAANVFFDFIKPFLQDVIVKNLDETIATCRTRKLKPEEPYIRETAMLLDGYLIDPIYRYMAEIDQKIRGKGNPKSVGRKDITGEITEMIKFLDKCKDEMIQGIKEQNGHKADLETARTAKKTPLYKKAWPYIIGAAVFLATILAIVWYVVDLKKQFYPK